MYLVRCKEDGISWNLAGQSRRQASQKAPGTFVRESQSQTAQWRFVVAGVNLEEGSTRELDCATTTSWL